MADIERLEVGAHLFIHRPLNQRTSKLLITSHGAIALVNGKKSLGLPSGTKLHFYVPHGYALMDPGLTDVIKGSVKPLEYLTPDQCPDYMLSKYQEKGGETYGDIENAIRVAEYGRTHSSHRADAVWPADILTVRNRGRIGKILGVPLLSALEELGKKGLSYTDIYCCFCRCKVAISEYANHPLRQLRQHHNRQWAFQNAHARYSG